MSLASERLGLLLCCFSLLACEQLGNPAQLATGPTQWKDARGHLVTTTRSFRDEKTIRRLLSDGFEELDYVDPSIGPSQTLTLVFVAPRSIRPVRGRKVKLVTLFKLPNREPIVRHWAAPASGRRWHGAFALPDSPIGAVTSLAP